MLQFQAEQDGEVRNEFWLKTSDKFQGSEAHIYVTITWSNNYSASAVLQKNDNRDPRALEYFITFKTAEVVFPSVGEIQFQNWETCPSGQIHCDFYATRNATITGGRKILSLMGYFVPNTGEFSEITDGYTSYIGNANSTPKVYSE